MIGPPEPIIAWTFIDSVDAGLPQFATPQRLQEMLNGPDIHLSHAPLHWLMANTNKSGSPHFFRKCEQSAHVLIADVFGSLHLDSHPAIQDKIHLDLTRSTPIVEGTATGIDIRLQLMKRVAQRRDLQKARERGEISHLRLGRHFFPQVERQIVTQISLGLIR